MIDTKAMAYVNMYGVLGTLENLCAMDEEAKAILARLKDISIRPAIHCQWTPLTSQQLTHWAPSQLDILLWTR